MRGGGRRPGFEATDSARSCHGDLQEPISDNWRWIELEEGSVSASETAEEREARLHHGGELVELVFVC